MSNETQRNNIEQFNQKVKFPTFDYQGLPVLYALMLIFSVWVMVTERFIYTPPFFFFLFFTSIGLLIEWWYRVRFIARNDGEDWVVIGLQFTEKFILNQKRFPVSELTFDTYSKTTGDDRTNYVQLFHGEYAILDCPGYEDKIRSIIPELFDEKKTIEETVPIKAEVTEETSIEKTDDFWSNIKPE
tara:strand:- start:1204 stop:1761 length:558 start_codon:yes stop_codon:yes gene_type:complete